MTRAVLYTLLATVAGAAAVLSFSALRDLALMCGFHESLAWMLPLVIDAGAAAGSVTWLARTGQPREFGRLLALVLLGSSVAGNALSHFLAAFSIAPAWWVVVTVSAVAPAVLGAVVHLATLMTKETRSGVQEDAQEPPVATALPCPCRGGAPSTVPAGLPEPTRPHLVRDVGSAASARPVTVNATPTPPTGIPAVAPVRRVSPARTAAPTTRAGVAAVAPDLLAKAKPLVLDHKYGRGRLSEALGIDPYDAREIIKHVKASQ